MANKYNKGCLEFEGNGYDIMWHLFRQNTNHKLASKIFINVLTRTNDLYRLDGSSHVLDAYIIRQALQSIHVWKSDLIDWYLLYKDVWMTRRAMIKQHKRIQDNNVRILFRILRNQCGD